jgi:hypothetical protein
MNALSTSELARKLKADYQKEWRLRNKIKVKEHNAKYWLKKAKKELSR